MLVSHHNRSSPADTPSSLTPPYAHRLIYRHTHTHSRTYELVHTDIKHIQKHLKLWPSSAKTPGCAAAAAAVPVCSSAAAEGTPPCKWCAAVYPPGTLPLPMNTSSKDTKLSKVEELVTGGAQLLAMDTMWSNVYSSDHCMHQMYKWSQFTPRV
jgi:hypothetical protein